VKDDNGFAELKKDTVFLDRLLQLLKAANPNDI